MPNKIRQMSDTELANHIITEEVRRMHLPGNNVVGVREATKETVKILSDALLAGDDEAFDEATPRALMHLALLDHMLDQRTSGIVCDYLNF